MTDENQSPRRKFRKIKVRSGLVIGIFVILFTVAFFYVVNLRLENQSLQAQVNQQKAAQNVVYATPTPVSQDSIVEEANNSVPAVTAADNIQGSLQAKVYFVQYSDLECPFCKQFHEATLPGLEQEFADSIAFVWRDFPLDIHPDANMEAQIAECVAKLQGQNAFFHFVDTVYSKTQSTGTSFDEAGFLDLASSVGYAAAPLKTCYENGETKDLVTNSLNQGKALGVNGTPTSYIIRASDGKTKMIIGAEPRAVFEEAINDLVASAP